MTGAEVTLPSWLFVFMAVATVCLVAAGLAAGVEAAWQLVRRIPIRGRRRIGMRPASFADAHRRAHHDASLKGVDRR